MSSEDPTIGIPPLLLSPTKREAIHDHTSAGQGGLLDIAGIVNLCQFAGGPSGSTTGITVQQNATFTSYSEARQVITISGVESGALTDVGSYPWRKTINLRKLASHFSDIRFVSKVHHFTLTETAEMDLFNVTDNSQIVENVFATTDYMITSANIQATLVALTNALKTVAVRVKSTGVARKGIVEAYLELRE